jgi:Coenzyme PQQ synthesis protein D (PqqD)
MSNGRPATSSSGLSDRRDDLLFQREEKKRDRPKQYGRSEMKSSESVVPKARDNELVFQEIEDELLVYDLKRHQAHCLNRTAALIWENCDGKKTVRGLARLLEQKSGVVTDEEVVWLGLSQLNKSHLLQEEIAPSAGPATVSRRELGRRLGAATALSLPLITSIVSPTAAQAVSRRPDGSSCEVDADCASNCCVANICSPVEACGTSAAQGRQQSANSRR